MIVSSHNNTLLRMGADPPYRGRKLAVATAMVGLDAYENIVDGFYTKLDAGMVHSIVIQPPKFLDTCQEEDQ